MQTVETVSRGEGEKKKSAREDMTTPQTSTNISGLTQPLLHQGGGGRSQKENNQKWRETKKKNKMVLNA